MVKATKRDVRITLPQTFFCGGVAGFTAKTITAPLDVVKIRAQVGTKDSIRGFFNAFLKVYLDCGVKGFWRGNLMGCLRLLPYSGLQFAAFQRLKLQLVDVHGRLNPTHALIAGAGGGIIATVTLYPTDTVKTRLIVQHCDKSKAHYKGIYDAFRVIIHEEGILALYRGLSTSLLGVIPFTGTTFMVYELLDRAYHLFNSQLEPMKNFVNGCTAAACAQTVSFPFDTIRKKMQAKSDVLPDRGGVDVEFRGMIQAFSATIKKYGVKGLWYGTTANLVRVVPYTGVMFVIFEGTKRIFLYGNGYTTSPFTDLPLPDVDQSLKPHELEELQNLKHLDQSVS